MKIDFPNGPQTYPSKNSDSSMRPVFDWPTSATIVSCRGDSHQDGEGLLFAAWGVLCKVLSLGIGPKVSG